MSFVPPQFSKFGKSVKDLFGKKFDFEYEVATKHKASKGVTVEAGGVGAGGAITGKTTVNYKNKEFGSLELNLKTDGKDKNQKAKVTLDKLADGLEVVLSGDARPAGNVEVSYSQDFFAGSASASSDSKITASGTIGHDGLSVGAEVKADTSGSVNDYNVGCQYAQSDFTLTLKTASKGEEISLSFFQKLSNATSLGSLFYHNPETDVRKLAFGLEHSYDSATTLKTKVDTSGTLGTAIQHRLDQGPLLGLAGSFNVLSKQPFAAQKFGVSLKFGDF
jgi:hypothetical protein